MKVFEQKKVYNYASSTPTLSNYKLAVSNKYSSNFFTKYDMKKGDNGGYAVNLNKQMLPITNFVNKAHYLQYNKLIGFDIETVKYYENIDISESRLNTVTENNLYQFSIYIPNSSELDKILVGMYKILSIYDLVPQTTIKKQMLKFLKIKGVKSLTNDFNSISFDFRESVSWERNEQIYFINVAGEDTYLNLKILSSMLESSTFNWVGFNSNSFDSNIFLHEEAIDNRGNSVPRYELREDYSKNSIKITSKRGLLKKNIKKEIFDLKKIASGFGLSNLKKIGEFLKMPKLDADEKLTLESRIIYNNRDVEILYEFVRYLNNISFDFGDGVSINGIFINNLSSFTRKFFINHIFEKYQAEGIIVDGGWNDYRIGAARVEAYKLFVDKAIYVDFNSLFQSSRASELKVPSPNTSKLYRKENGIKTLHYELNKLEQFEIDIFKGGVSCFYEHYKSKMNKFSNNYIDSMLAYEEIFNKFYFCKVKIKGFKAKVPSNIRKKLKFFFPYSFKDDQRKFRFNKNVVYDVMQYEVMYLTFFDYEIIDIKSCEYCVDESAELIKKIYKERQKNKKENPKVAQLFKGILNTGYGILATKNQKTEILDINNLDKAVVKAMHDIKENILPKYSGYTFEGRNSIFNDVVLSNHQENFNIKHDGKNFIQTITPDSQPYTKNSILPKALGITSNARFMMFENIFMNNILCDGVEIYIYYTDTDSAMLEPIFYNEIKVMKSKTGKTFFGEELGQMKNELKEHQEIRYGTFVAGKSYAYFYYDHKENKWGGDIKLKGTGTSVYRESGKNGIIVNNRKLGFDSQDRLAFSPDRKQKRVLNPKTLLFENEEFQEKDFILWKKTYEIASLNLLLRKKYVALGKSHMMDDKKINKLIKRIYTKDFYIRRFSSTIENSIEKWVINRKG